MSPLSKSYTPVFFVAAGIRREKLFNKSQHLILYPAPCLSLGSSLSLTLISSCRKVVMGLTDIGETGRNLNTRLTEHKRATRNGDLNNNIAEHHLQTNHRIDWDSAECMIYSTDYHQRLTLESWFTNLEQTPLNRCQQLPAPYKRLINDSKTDEQ